MTCTLCDQFHLDSARTINSLEELLSTERAYSNGLNDKLLTIKEEAKARDAKLKALIICERERANDAESMLKTALQAADPGQKVILADRDAWKRRWSDRDKYASKLEKLLAHLQAQLDAAIQKVGWARVQLEKLAALFPDFGLDPSSTNYVNRLGQRLYKEVLLLQSPPSPEPLADPIEELFQRASQAIKDGAVGDARRLGALAIHIPRKSNAQSWILHVDRNTLWDGVTMIDMPFARVHELYKAAAEVQLRRRLEE